MRRRNHRGNTVRSENGPFTEFSRFLEHVFATYQGRGIESTGKRLGAMRIWLSSAGRTRALASIEALEGSSEGASEAELAESLWMAPGSYRKLKRWVSELPFDDVPPPRVFVSYKWESGEHVAWVRQLASDLREAGIDAILDQWKLRLGGSITDYMQRSLGEADAVLAVITDGFVEAAEAPQGKGGAVKFEVQLMNARRMSEGTKVIGIYRSGERPPQYLRDHRYADFRQDARCRDSLQELVSELLEQGGPPPPR